MSIPDKGSSSGGSSPNSALESTELLPSQKFSSTEQHRSQGAIPKKRVGTTYGSGKLNPLFPPCFKGGRGSC